MPGTVEKSGPAGWRAGLATARSRLSTAVLQWRWREMWLGPACAALIVLLNLASGSPQGRLLVCRLGVVHPGDGLATTAARLPLSVFAPADLLPVGFAFLQVIVIFAMAQVLVGLRRALTVGFIGHVVATLSSRGWLWLGPPIGVPHRHYLQMGDSGPSVAVIALIAYVAVAYRQHWVPLGILLYEAVELTVFDGLTQREHLMGALTGIALAYAGPVRRTGGRFLQEYFQSRASTTRDHRAATAFVGRLPEPEPGHCPTMPPAR